MPPRSVEDQELIQTFRATQDIAQTAQAVGLHRTTVVRRLKALKINGAKTVALEHAGNLVAHGVDAFEQIIDINNKSRKLLDTLLKDGVLVHECAECGTKEAIEPTSSNNKALAVKVMAEIRGQLKTQLDYLNCLYDLKANAEFQKAVIDSIGEASPDVKRAILDKLQSERAIRSAVQFN